MKMTMRKLVALLLSAALLTSAFAGCSSGGSGSSGTESETGSAASTSTSEESGAESGSTATGEVTTLKIMGIDKTATVARFPSPTGWRAAALSMTPLWRSWPSMALPWSWT